MFGGEVDILHNRDIGEEAISPTDQLAAQDIGGDHSDQVEQEEEADDPQPRDVELSMKKIDRHLRA